MLHLFEWPVLGHITEDRRRKKPNAQRKSNPQPPLWGMCSNTVLQPLHLVLEEFEMVDPTLYSSW